MTWSDAIRHALRADGVLTVHRAAAVTGRQPVNVRRRAMQEGWGRPFPGVLVVPGVSLRGRTLARAALEYCRTPKTPQSSASRSALGPVPASGAGVRRYGSADAALTRDSAVAALGLRRSWPTQVAVALPHEHRLRPHARLEIVRSRSSVEQERIVLAGLPILVGTALLRSFARHGDQASLRSLAIDLRVAGHLDLAAAQERLDACGPFAGKAVLRAALDDLHDAGRTDSALEWRVRADLRAAGVALDRGQVAVPGTRLHLDLGIARIRFGIEVDSMRHHSSLEDLRRDAERANQIAALPEDWVVLHVTWHTVQHGWPPFVALVRAIVDRRRAAT